LSRKFTESTVEEAALQWLEELGYAVLHGSEIEPEGPQEERANFSEILLVERLRAALARINPGIPADAREDAVHKLTRAEHPSLVENNRQFHWYLVEGVPVEHLQPSPRPSPSGRGERGEGFGAKPELEVLLKGIFEQRRFLELVRDFVVFATRHCGRGRPRRWPATTSSTRRARRSSKIPG